MAIIYDLTKRTGGGGGTPFYSGSLTLAERPTVTGDFATLNAPNCTNFLMVADTAPSNSTGNAYFGFGYIEKSDSGKTSVALGSNNAGSGVGSSGAGYTWDFSAAPRWHSQILVTFNTENIVLSTNSVASSARLPQTGITYKWFAW